MYYNMQIAKDMRVCHTYTYIWTKEKYKKKLRPSIRSKKFIISSYKQC